jgi:hypothetical protein
VCDNGRDDSNMSDKELKNHNFTIKQKKIIVVSIENITLLDSYIADQLPHEKKRYMSEIMENSSSHGRLDYNILT